MTICLYRELYDTIIDCIDDPITLGACSLSCKAFLPTSRRHLFHTIDLFNRDIANRFIDIICSAPAATNPSSYVRRLRIQEGRDLYEEFDPLWFNTALPILTTTLLEVTVLELENMRWNSLDDEVHTIFMSGFQKFKGLKMVFGKFQTSEEMYRLISTFPSLTHLEICEPYCTDHLTLTIPLIPLPITLKFLSLPSDYSNHFEQLLSMEAHPHIHALELKFEYLADIRSIGRLLNMTASGLEHLDLDKLWSTRDAEACISLASCVNLRSIAIGFDIPYDGSYNPDCVYTFLSQIISPHMVDVSFRIRLETVSDLDKIDWARLEGILTNNPQWVDLENITIWLSCHPEVRVAAVEFFCARLPILVGYGIVWVGYRGFAFQI